MSLHCSKLRKFRLSMITNQLPSQQFIKEVVDLNQLFIKHILDWSFLCPAFDFTTAVDDYKHCMKILEDRHGICRHVVGGSQSLVYTLTSDIPTAQRSTYKAGSYVQDEDVAGQSVLVKLTNTSDESAPKRQRRTDEAAQDDQSSSIPNQLNQPPHVKSPPILIQTMSPHLSWPGKAASEPVRPLSLIDFDSTSGAATFPYGVLPKISEEKKDDEDGAEYIPPKAGGVKNIVPYATYLTNCVLLKVSPAAEGAIYEFGEGRFYVGETEIEHRLVIVGAGDIEGTVWLDLPRKKSMKFLIATEKVMYIFVPGTFTYFVEFPDSAALDNVLENIEPSDVLNLSLTKQYVK